jgi:hypothetical protein
MSKIQIITPQFNRPDNQPTAVRPPPATPVEWHKLRSMTVTQLKALGCGSWDGRLMLFPATWYSFIPEGFEFEDIRVGLKPSNQARPMTTGASAAWLMGCLL